MENNVYLRDAYLATQTNILYNAIARTNPFRAANMRISICGCIGGGFLNVAHRYYVIIRTRCRRVYIV